MSSSSSVPIAAKWTRGSIAFEIARLLRKCRTASDGYTLDEITKIVFSNVSYESRFAVQKAIIKLRKDDRDGTILLVYGDYVVNAEGMAEFRYFNVGTRAEAEPILERLEKISAGIEARVEQIKDILDIPEEERIEALNDALEAYRKQKLKDLPPPPMVAAEPAQPTLPTKQPVLPSELTRQKYGLIKCKYCNEHYEKEVIMQHMTEHTLELLAKHKHIIIKRRAKKKESSEEAGGRE